MTSTPTTGPDGQEEEGFTNAIKRALLRKTGAKFVADSFVPRLIALHRHGLDRIIELVRSAPDGLGVPKLVEWVEAHADDDIAAAAIDPQELAARLANLRRTMAAWAEAGADPPADMLAAEAALVQRLAEAGHHG